MPSPIKSSKPNASEPSSNALQSSEPKSSESKSCESTAHESSVSESAVMQAFEKQAIEKVAVGKRAIDKESNVHGAQIAERFSAAAHSYQDHNQLQRLSAASLLSEFIAQGHLLDIGAGPGTDFAAYHSEHQSGCHSEHGSIQNPPTAVFAVDIALGMLHKLKQTYPDYHGVCADAECLPFVDGCIDVIYSNLALQWCANFPAAVAEMARVLKPDGECHLSLVAQGSLNQLAELGLRVNDFSTLEALKTAFKLDTWQFLEVQLIPMTVYFDTLKALLYSIKGVGASVQSASATHSASSISLANSISLDHSTIQSAGEVAGAIAAAELAPRLRGRQDWQALQAKAESLRVPQGLPLTYQIVQIRARRRM
ncbi:MULTISPECIES: methyltransferase domain-containing protein [unclassified Shewanella]|uniref:methyltransferase domain-containing protein n=1 Tax=Shewanella TaxID=22 RepID=UPI0021DB11EC|nr:MULTISPECIES: methyltransferase domain-containing protein [unclassified Shewanella]MCU7997817.1 methyltransferase domain-containing protein [Shewanella sp. SM95]MCU8107192.1 methyltransferase domain-containing protein [Shewanella sp. SM101]